MKTRIRSPSLYKYTLDDFGDVGTKEPLHQNKDATAQFVLFRFMVRIRN